MSSIWGHKVKTFLHIFLHIFLHRHITLTCKERHPISEILYIYNIKIEWAGVGAFGLIKIGMHAEK